VGVCESFAGRSGTGWQQRKRFAGSRVNENNWSIDGTSFSDGVDNTQTGPLANDIESFQEVHVDLSNELCRIRLDWTGDDYLQVTHERVSCDGI
jgi:hypothetical protein